MPRRAAWRPRDSTIEVSGNPPLSRVLDRRQREIQCAQHRCPSLPTRKSVRLGVLEHQLWGRRLSSVPRQITAGAASLGLGVVSPAGPTAGVAASAPARPGCDTAAMPARRRSPVAAKGVTTRLIAAPRVAASLTLVPPRFIPQRLKYVGKFYTRPPNVYSIMSQSDDLYANSRPWRESCF
jgi:hypothetical protein